MEDTVDNLPQHKDMLGRTVKLGDVIVTCSNNHMYVATVIKINPKMVRVKRHAPREYSVNKYPKDLVILDSKDVMIYLLKNGG
jgi:hypothetical protein